MKKYWHELTKQEQSSAIKGMTWGQFVSRYKQPDWCKYPNALEELGYWSLIGGSVHCREDCGQCEQAKAL